MKITLAELAQIKLKQKYIKTNKDKFYKCLGLVAFFRSHNMWPTLSHCWLYLNAPTSGSQGKLNSWLLSMSSSIEYPVLWILGRGWSFHLTRYFKYSLFRVFLATCVSKICSISKGCARGICLIHVLSSFLVSLVHLSEPSSSSKTVYGYKSATLKMDEIPTPRGN